MGSFHFVVRLIQIRIYTLWWCLDEFRCHQQSLSQTNENPEYTPFRESVWLNKQFIYPLFGHFAAPPPFCKFGFDSFVLFSASRQLSRMRWRGNGKPHLWKMCLRSNDVLFRVFACQVIYFPVEQDTARSLWLQCVTKLSVFSFFIFWRHNESFYLYLREIETMCQVVEHFPARSPVFHCSSIVDFVHEGFPLQAKKKNNLAWMFCGKQTETQKLEATQKVWMPCGFTMQICLMLWDTAGSIWNYTDIWSHLIATMMWKKPSKYPTTKETQHASRKFPSEL